jgi:hypothetical protein
MRIWEAELLKDLICWFLASISVVRIGQPVLDSLKHVVEISLSMMTHAPALAIRGEPLSRGPTFSGP